MVIGRIAGTDEQADSKDFFSFNFADDIAQAHIDDAVFEVVIALRDAQNLVLRFKLTGILQQGHRVEVQ